jgi:hypothetical protein
MIPDTFQQAPNLPRFSLDVACDAAKQRRGTMVGKQNRVPLPTACSDAKFHGSLPNAHAFKVSDLQEAVMSGYHSVSELPRPGKCRYASLQTACAPIESRLSLLILFNDFQRDPKTFEWWIICHRM